MERREQLKQIRRAIADATSQEERFRHLAAFQQLMIDSDFAWGEKEIYRYVKALEKAGLPQEAERQRQKVDQALENFWRGIKAARLRQIARLHNPKWVTFFCRNDDAPLVCQQAHNTVEPYANSPLLLLYKECPLARCHCFVAVTNIKLKR